MFPRRGTTSRVYVWFRDCLDLKTRKSNGPRSTSIASTKPSFCTPLGFRDTSVQAGFQVLALGFSTSDSGLRVQGLGFEAQSCIFGSSAF